MIEFQPESRVVFFRTKLGWMGIASLNGRIQKLAFGSETREEIATRFELSRLRIERPNSIEKEWIEEMKSYARGDEYNFQKIELDLDGKTEFQLTVIGHCRDIPHGQTVAYGELAKIAGSPRAARAVGTIMSQNNVPLIIPCHRVVAASGLGGFSAPRGVSAKMRLLKHEGNVAFVSKQKQLLEV